MRIRPFATSLFQPLPDNLKQMLIQSGVVPVVDKLLPLWNLPEDTNTVVLIGSRGGAKTYGVSDLIAYRSTTDNKRCVILRDEKELVRESILNDILLRYDSAYQAGVVSNKYQRLDTGIKNKVTNEMVVFTKGFRASSLEKKANLKGASNIDIAVVEEAEDIRDVTKYNTFADSIRKEGALIIIILNVPDLQHWIIKRFFNVEAVTDVFDTAGKQIDGYYKLIPKDLPGFVCIQTNFEDNMFLPPHIVSNYKGYGDPNSHLYNLHYYLTEIKGYASSGRKGQILKKVKPMKLADYLALPFKEIYGQDFGTSSPAGTVGVKFDKNNCYARQLNYLPMPTLDIGKMYCRLKFNGGDKIVCDNADEKAWRKLKKGWTPDELEPGALQIYPGLASGFHTVPCTKGSDSIIYGLDLMDSMNLFAVEESTDLWEEINNYIYDQDKNDNYTNDPVDEYNHLIDPWRYVVNDQRGKRKFLPTTG